MSLLSMLTAIFVTLKLTDTIDWSWFLVLSPTIFQISVYVLVVGLAVFIRK
jgi:hypothetical protein